MQNADPKRDPLLNTTDAAELLGLTSSMVRVLVRQGKLAPDEKTKGGYSFFRQSTIKQLAADRELQRKAKKKPAHRPLKPLPRRSELKK